MMLRLTVAAICFITAMFACTIANISIGKMAAALSREDGPSVWQLRMLPWGTWSDFGRRYPDSPLPRRARIALIIQFAGMIGVAIAIGIIPMLGRPS